MPDKRAGGHGLLRMICLVLILIRAALSLLPLVETNAWWVRYLDFIRLQLAFLLGAAIIFYLAAGVRRADRVGAIRGTRSDWRQASPARAR